MAAHTPYVPPEMDASEIVTTDRWEDTSIDYLMALAAEDKARLHKISVSTMGALVGWLSTLDKTKPKQAAVYARCSRALLDFHIVV